MRIVFGVVLWAFTLIVGPSAAYADASSLMAQALELLQKNEKSKALKLLEKAFETAQDPECVKEAAVLIIQASPSQYPKREAYLRYLTQRNRDHENAGEWFKELGDKAFDRADFNQAEEYYLNAQNLSPDSFLIRYKLAWTFWNQKRRNEALCLFLDLSLAAHTQTQVDTESFRDSLKRDISKLWWEIGPLPANTFSKIFNGPTDYQEQIFSELWAIFPSAMEPAPKYIEFLKQIKDDERSKMAWAEFLARDLYFKSNPCFLISNVFGPDYFASIHTLLACAKDSRRPDIEVLKRHFEKRLPEADENFVRAYAHLLQDSGKNDQALITLAGWSGFENASKDLKAVVGSLLAGLSEEDFPVAANAVSNERLEVILKAHPHDLLLHRLQGMDPDRWIPFEESVRESKPPSRDYLLRKAIWMSKKYNDNRSEIEGLVHQLLDSPKTDEEKVAKKVFQNLEKRLETQLPGTFGNDLTKKLNAWIENIDKDMTHFQELSLDWQNLTGPMVQVLLKKNLDSLKDQLDQVQLPQDVSTQFADAFVAKRAEIKDNLSLKYSSFLGPS